MAVGMIGNQYNIIIPTLVIVISASIWETLLLMMAVRYLQGKFLNIKGLKKKIWTIFYTFHVTSTCLSKASPKCFFRFCIAVWKRDGFFYRKYYDLSVNIWVDILKIAFALRADVIAVNQPNSYIILQRPLSNET